ncbi:methylenetetrahydrofolate reductase [NAD(P)H] [Gottschalkiaceae bacterium SANA]|nr:methylenetetrahydrofolate reductase [NAD(P)H] [Gottschalkiaceae bacterium SANA]
MKIRDMLLERKPTVSFEVFPPKRDYPIETIHDTISGLKDLHPDFISVTYGAAGSTQNHTVEIASKIKNEFGIETLAHLTCVTSTQDQIKRVLHELRENQIENLLAMRGDLPESYLNKPDFSPQYHYASELIREIHADGDWSIGGACYPEGHIESKNKLDDIKFLKQKTDEGLDFLVTQLFFDNEMFFQFQEKLELLDIRTPVIAGIFPFVNIRQIKRIQEISGCNLPPKFLRILERYEHSPKALQEAGIAYAVDQIIDLLSSGVDGIHIYTMNKPEVTKRIMRSINHVRSTLNG